MPRHRQTPTRRGVPKHTAISYFVSAVLLGMGGCNDGRFPTAPVSGLVTLDGKPVTEGTVIFTPKQGWPAQGTLDSEGQFTLTTYKAGDGAIVGPNQIVVVAVTEEDPSEHFERPPTKPVRSLIPERYGSPATSGLSHEVKAGETNVVQLELVLKGPRP